MKQPLPADSWHDHPGLEKWIPFIGPGMGLFFLFIIYLILADIF